MTHARSSRSARLLAPFALLALVAAAAAAPVAAAAPTAPAAAAPAPAASASSAQAARGTARTVFVGNNWEGTVDVLRPGTLRRVARIDAIPDRDERMAEIATNPQRLAFFLAIREAIGEGHDQFVDDMYSSNDGRTLVVSRPSFADVVSRTSRPARSCGASRSTASARTTWPSRPTAAGWS